MNNEDIWKFVWVGLLLVCAVLAIFFIIKPGFDTMTSVPPTCDTCDTNSIEQVNKAIERCQMDCQIDMDKVWEEKKAIAKNASQRENELTQKARDNYELGFIDGINNCLSKKMWENETV